MFDISRKFPPVTHSLPGASTGLRSQKLKKVGHGQRNVNRKMLKGRFSKAKNGFIWSNVFLVDDIFATAMTSDSQYAKNPLL
jgi:hypothetical protein